MSYRTTVALLVLLAAVGAYMYFYGLRPEEPEAPVDTSNLKVFNLETGSIRSLEVRQAGKNVLVKRNSQGGWDLAEPEQFEGDNPRLVNAVETAATLTASRVFTATEVGSLADYGLDKPETRVIIGVGSNDYAELLVGNQNPGGSGSYVKRPDSDNVYLVDSYWINVLKGLLIELPKAKPTPTPFPEPSPTPVSSS
ncbi:MAG: DUF4340 domain-containing protein [Chloroflexi bacterium]|nr:DUF4340 domain-containing protein [Chloroflexota bacterium]